jgi:4'-phosphopantetheinyl transferase EntD
VRVAQTLEAILPRGAVAVERDAPPDGPPTLFPCEEALIANAVEGRRREFAEGRACAREALRRLGAPAGAIPADSSGVPCWPAGIVGSITHKGSYRAAAVAPADRIAGLGIDAELEAALPAGVLETIASPRELDDVERLLVARPGVAWDRLLFSAKEAVVKASQPLGVHLAGARAVEVALDAAGSFTATPAASLSAPAQPVRGAWTARSGLLLAAASVPSAAAGAFG